MVMWRPAGIIGFSLVLRYVRHLSLSRLTHLAMPSVWLSAAFAPAIGFFSSGITCCMLYFLRTSLSLISHAHVAGCFLYLPTLAGSLVLSTNSKLFKILIPLSCMGLFLVHPTGAHSWLYTLYWLIPIGISCLSSRSIVLKSLASTFTTHAVGSTIYLYTHPTTSLYWHALIGQVWIERLSYALILTLSYYVIYYCRYYITHFWEGRACHGQLLFS